MKILLNSGPGGFNISDQGITELQSLGFNSKDIENLKKIPQYTQDYRCRTHPDLIKTFEKLGQKMNGKNSTLYIDNIPPGYNYDCWKVSEYKGDERLELIQYMYKAINLEKENNLLKLENQKLKEECEHYKNKLKEKCEHNKNSLELSQKVTQIIVGDVKNILLKK